MKGENYDEFKAFVKCSQLQPVSRTEVGQLFQPATSITKTPVLNKTASKQKSSIYQPSINQPSNINVMSKTSETDAFCRPCNVMEFERIWKTKLITLSEKSQYILLQTTPKFIGKLYAKLEMNGAQLGEIIETLYYITHHPDMLNEESNKQPLTKGIDGNVWEIIYNWMKMCTKRTRFSINISFLEEKHKEMVQSVLKSLVEATQNVADVQIKEKSLLKLYTQFGLRA